MLSILRINIFSVRFAFFMYFMFDILILFVSIYLYSAILFFYET